MATVLHPGRLSPTRQVPANIPRPEYVGKKQPRLGEPDVKDADTIARMRVAGQLAAQALEEVGRHIRPGVTTDYLDQVGHDFLVSHGAYPSTLGYRGYPKSLCTSLNEVICHGIPDDTVVGDGDIVNIDITAIHRRRARRHQRHLPGRRRGRGVAAAGGAHPRGDDARHQGRGPRTAAERHRAGHRVLRQAVRLRGGARLHRPRHRHHLPLRADRAALRRSRRRR